MIMVPLTTIMAAIMAIVPNIMAVTSYIGVIFCQVVTFPSDPGFIAFALFLV
jgi:hypothetical protein